MEIPAKILVVDDTPQNITLMRAMLTAGGYQVVTAQDGKEALLKVREEPPDLILLDVMMPKLDGYSVCAQLKREEEARLIPIILTTPSLRGKERVKAIEVGGNDLLERPFAQAELLARVKSLIQAKHLKEGLVSLESAIAALAIAVETKDPLAENHLERMVDLATGLGRELGLSPEEQELLRRGSILHDVGKIGIRESVLLKKTPLTKREFEHVKTHPILGERICRPLKDKLISELVRHHHERYDGKGYPDGLTGKQIPLCARIITLADSYDIMTSKRPYQRTLSPQEALNELRQQSGKQFDPLLVLTFVSMMETSGRL